MTLTLNTQHGDLLIGPKQLLGIALSLLALYLCGQYSYLLFHSLVEVARIIILGGIFVLAWHAKNWGANNFLLMIGIASMFVGGIELLHTLAYKGLGVFSEFDANLPTQLWIVFRYLEAFSWLAALLVLHRKVNPFQVVVTYGGVSLLLLGWVFGGWFPDCFVEGQGLTLFKITSEYLIIGLFVISLGVLFQRRHEFDPGVLKLIMASLGFTVGWELAFTRYVNVFGFANELGHYLLIVSAYLLYRAVLITGLVSPFDLLFRDLKKNELELEQRVAQRTSALQVSEAQATAFAENSPALMYQLTLDGRFTQVNQALVQWLGQLRGDILGKTMFDLFEPATAEKLERHDRTARIEQHSSVIEELVTLGDSDRILETARFPILDAGGNVIATGAVATDVTAIRQAQARYGSILKTSMDAFVIVDLWGHFLEVNDAACELTGYSSEALLDMGLADIEAHQDATAIEANLRQITAAGFSRFESRWRQKLGDIRDIEVSVNYLDDLSGVRFFAFVRDITQRKAAVAQIDHLAYFDALTNLPNRRLFEDQFTAAAQQAQQQQSKLALLYLDLDNFKVINDTLGHVLGDTLIREIAQRLIAGVSSADCVGRVGGDEFLILLTQVQKPDTVTVVVQNLLSELAQPMLIEKHQLVTTASMGVAFYPDDGADFSTLLKQVDTSMFQAKADGRNTYRFFDEKMNAQANDRLELLSHLHGALERQEFVLHYQPQIELATGRLVGAEALIRWQSPQLGLIPPARFIPLAEDSGLIVAIGAWVLRQACLQAVQWRQMGCPDFVMAVNLSAVQFRSPGLFETVCEALLSSQLTAEGLELELTESILIGDTDTTLAYVKRLKTLGLKLSIDDFGTGYSSLSYLKRFKVDKLKIDQSFIRDMDQNPDDSAIVHAIIQMAHSLGLKTIAEGVEHEHMISHLRIHQCDEVQGYFYGRPMPAAEFEAYLLSSPKYRRQMAF